MIWITISAQWESLILRLRRGGLASGRDPISLEALRPEARSQRDKTPRSVLYDMLSTGNDMADLRPVYLD